MGEGAGAGGADVLGVRREAAAVQVVGAAAINAHSQDVHKLVVAAVLGKGASAFIPNQFGNGVESAVVQRVGAAASGVIAQKEAGAVLMPRVWLKVPLP